MNTRDNFTAAPSHPPPLLLHHPPIPPPSPDVIRDVVEAIMYRMCLSNAVTVAEGVEIVDEERKANKLLTYQGDEIVAAFVTAKADVKTAPNDDAKKLALKKALFRLVRMDLEVLVGPLAEPNYKPCECSE